MKKFLTYTLIAAMALGFCGIAIVNVQARGGINQPAFEKNFAQRFNLNTGEVKEFLNEGCAERIQERFGATEEQAEDLRVKKAQITERYGSFENLSFEERGEMKQEMRQEMSAWAQENEIEFGARLGRGSGKGLRRGRSISEE